MCLIDEGNGWSVNLVEDNDYLKREIFFLLFKYRLF